MSLKGKTLVFTGTLSMKRAEATQLAEKAGATVTAAVSGKTSILVVGTGAGSKLAEAKAKGIDVWTEEEFQAFVKGGAKGGAAPKAAAVVAAAPTPSAPTKPAGRQPKGKTARPADDEEDEKETAPAKKARKTESTPTPAAANSAAKAANRPATAVDREVPSRANYTVVEDYRVLLNQTNIDGNNNKFYIIQLLHGGGDKYAMWTRWGRNGEVGQHALEPAANLAAAKVLFERKFRDKTQNAWSARGKFVKVAGKYMLVEVDEDEGDSSGGGASATPKLSRSQIEKGQQVLERIEAALSSSKSKSAKDAELVELSSQFFSLIPTNFGRQRPEPIKTEEKLREKEELLKFYLRMGFEQESEKQDKPLTPISGVMDLPLAATLAAAIGPACAASAVTSSVSKGEKLAKAKAGNPKIPMDKQLYGAIMLYTSNAIYRDLNRALREENRKEVQKYLSYLRMLLEATNRLPTKPTTLWRGVCANLFDQYKVGKTITWWGVSSCTSEESVARNFAGGCGADATLLIIDTKTACDISKITFYAHEKESLLLPGTQLLVKSAKKTGKLAEIHLEEIGRCVS